MINILVTSAFTVTAASCSVAPKSLFDGKAELAKLPGPETGSIDKTIMGQAQQAASNGDFRRAAQMYKQLADGHPDNKEYAIALADNLKRCGENDSALKTVNKLLEKHPSDADALELKGLILMNVGEFVEASKVFEKVMNVDSKRWRTLNALGVMFAIKRMDTQAIAYYNAALVVSPDNSSILNNLGLALAMDRQYDKCVDAFTSAKNHISGSNVDLKKVDLNFALAYATFGKLEEAETTAAPHLSKAALYNNMGFYAYVAKNKELAKVYLNKALTQNPVYYERAWKNLGALNGDVSSETNSGEKTNYYSARSKRVVVNEKPADNQEIKSQEIPASSGETEQKKALVAGAGKPDVKTNVKSGKDEDKKELKLQDLPVEAAKQDNIARVPDNKEKPAIDQQSPPAGDIGHVKPDIANGNENKSLKSEGSSDPLFTAP